MASVINQLKLGNIEYAIAASAYAECSTAAGTAAKVATINTDGDTTNNAFTLIKGVSVQVKFTNTNTVSKPTLNINSTGAKDIYYKGAAFNELRANGIYTFVYNGTQWDLVGEINTDTGATSVEVTGSGNVITAATYEASTRKVTLTKGVTAITTDTVKDEVAAQISPLISSGTDDPSASTTSQYYFKYN